MLKDYRIAPLAGGKPKRAVVFLHGVGDSGQGGLLSIGQLWQHAMPDCEFTCPDAPFAFDQAPAELVDLHRQWFSLNDFSQSEMLAGAKKATPFLNAYIDHVLTSRELPARHLAVVGFSQGTMMALYAMPRRDEQIACIAGYSGILVGSETLRAEKKSSPPILLVQGKLDEVVPFAAMEHAEQGLKAAAIPVATLACPHIGHSIDETGLTAGLEFVQKNLYPSAP